MPSLTPPWWRWTRRFVREQTYYPRLCLIQVATPDRLACVDCVAGMDLKPLFSALLAPGRTWLLHSVRQDLEAMQRLMFRLPSRLIDTQIAAALLGKTPQIGLQDLAAEELNVRLDKGFTRTNWARRPLPAGALQYALDDVRHLFALWGVLRGKLKGLNRLGWLEEDCRTALATPVLTPPAALWSRLRGGPRAQRQEAVRRPGAGGVARAVRPAAEPAAALDLQRRTAGAHRQEDAGPP